MQKNRIDLLQKERSADAKRAMSVATANVRLNARAARIRVATAALYGEWGGQTKMAARIGISKQMLSFIIHGDRPVTDKVEKAVADAVAREADRLRTTVKQFDAIAKKVLSPDYWTGTVKKRSAAACGLADRPPHLSQ